MNQKSQASETSFCFMFEESSFITLFLSCLFYLQDPNCFSDYVYH